MITKKEMNYVVWLQPKSKYIPERVLTPKNSNVKWSKKRAKEEAEFIRKNGIFTFDKFIVSQEIYNNFDWNMYGKSYKLSELYTYRVISESDAIKRGLISLNNQNDMFINY